MAVAVRQPRVLDRLGDGLTQRAASADRIAKVVAATVLMADAQLAPADAESGVAGPAARQPFQFERAAEHLLSEQAVLTAVFGLIMQVVAPMYADLRRAEPERVR